MPGTNAWWEDSDSEAEESARSLAEMSTHAAITARRRVVSFVLPDLMVDGRGPQGKKRMSEEDPFSWEAHLQRLDEEEFKRRYRLDFDSFNVLLERLRPELELTGKAALQAKRGNFGVVISPEVKLAIALRYLAGGDVLDLKLIYKVSRSYVYKCAVCTK